jgi:hypothetical protein
VRWGCALSLLPAGDEEGIKAIVYLGGFASCVGALIGTFVGGVINTRRHEPWVTTPVMDREPPSPRPTSMRLLLTAVPSRPPPVRRQWQC